MEQKDTAPERKGGDRPSAREPESGKQPSGLSWLLGQAKGHRGGYALSVLMAVCGVACQIAPYFVMADIVQMLLSGNRVLRAYLLRCLAMAILWTLRVIFHAVSTGCSHRATFAVLGEIRKRGTDHLAQMPLGSVLERQSGTLKSTLVENVDACETTLAHILPEFTSNLLAPICIFIVLLVTDWRMALVSLIPLPVGLICFMGMMIGYEEHFARAVNATKTLNDTAVEYIGGIEVIKVFGKTRESYGRFVAAARDAADSYVSWMRSCNLFFTLSLNIMPATLLTVLPIGGLLAARGTLAPETFIFCVILSVALITPVVTCFSYTDDLRQLDVLTGEIRKILDAPRMERPETAHTQPDGNSIVLSQVRFGYGETEVLHGIDMEIPEGSYVALVGPSGSGKSTIARLIAALWDVSGGSITLGGVDIRQLPLEEYSDRIAYVSQSNYLFDQTIRENIRMGRTNGTATDEEVEEAARRCGCHEFIMGLEHGYDTVAGSSGGHLSGGERQRIAIARAMLKDAPIVILDEATAYTDPESEALIQTSVARLVQDKTLIVIAHRLSTIQDADRIYVVDHGYIREQGTHGQLLEQNGLYRRMWASHISVRDRAGEGEERHD